MDVDGVLFLPWKQELHGKGYSKTCAKTTLFLTKYGGLKWEGQVKKCSGRKDKNTIIMVLGRFHCTFVLFSLLIHCSWKETWVSFQPVLLGTDMAMEEEGNSKDVCMSVEELKHLKLLVAAMVTTFRIKWKYKVYAFDLFAFPMACFISARSDLPVSTFSPDALLSLHLLECLPSSPDISSGNFLSRLEAFPPVYFNFAAMKSSHYDMPLLGMDVSWQCFHQDCPFLSNSSGLEF